MTLVFVQVGLFLGLLDNASVTIDHISADLWVTSRNTPNVDFAHTFPDTAVKRVRSVPGVAQADNLIVWFVTVNLPRAPRRAPSSTRSTIPQLEHSLERRGGDLGDLRRGSTSSSTTRPGQALRSFAVGEYREILGQRMKIIGRTKDARSFTTTPISFIDFDRAQTLNPQSLQGKTTYVLVSSRPAPTSDAVKAEIARRLPYNDVYTKKEWVDALAGLLGQVDRIGLNMYITVFLGCLVGIVVVAQTLYTSTMEHIKEFGTVKAIGGGNRDIYRILGKQASIAAVAGFLVGAAHVLRDAPGDREDRPEAHHHARLRRDRVRRGRSRCAWRPR